MVEKASNERHGAGFVGVSSIVLAFETSLSAIDLTSLSVEPFRRRSFDLRGSSVAIDLVDADVVPCGELEIPATQVKLSKLFVRSGTRSARTFHRLRRDFCWFGEMCTKPGERMCLRLFFTRAHRTMQCALSVAPLARWGIHPPHLPFMQMIWLVALTKMCPPSVKVYKDVLDIFRGTF